MTDKEKVEFYWAYAIFYEKVAKRLVEKRFKALNMKKND
jgi:hypothetical protein